uniref:Uncharacterized protein n=1 Tax=Daphnia galeata TaxID=27404 RepID=A0A8J2WJL1_9CRUS|nr:unnamed protein product [Daphnia galeata]
MAVLEAVLTYDVLEDAAQTNMMQLIDEHEGVGSSNTMSSLVKDVTSTHCCQCQLLAIRKLNFGRKYTGNRPIAPQLLS